MSRPVKEIVDAGALDDPSRVHVRHAEHYLALVEGEYALDEGQEVLDHHGAGVDPGPAGVPVVVATVDGGQRDASGVGGVAALGAGPATAAEFVTVPLGSASTQ